MSESSKEDYMQILKDFDFDTLDLSAIENWVPNCYTRNCFYRDDKFELILICWNQDQQTAIHDHNDEDCWVYLIKGELEEDYFKLNGQDKLEYVDTKTLLKNQITKSDKESGFHRLRNNTSHRAMSLHVYAKPITQSRTFDEKLECIVDKALKDDTFKCVAD